MSQCRHKNVVSYYVSFIDDSDLWLVMPLLNGGSVHDSLRQNFKNGLYWLKQKGEKINKICKES